MLAFLFRGLTAERASGEALFNALTAEARRPVWFVEGEVPDTLDGRFAVLATITALALVRLERERDEGNRASVALTERFITVMESEHRELGLGDPTLGKVVRKLVGMLARRTEQWRAAVAGEVDWTTTTGGSLYKETVSSEARDYARAALRDFWASLEATPIEKLMNGDIG
jgi:cytochrome b pre-mRNA-processing protein 3